MAKTEKNYVSINSLGTAERKRLKDAIFEMNDSLVRAGAERDIQKEILEKVETDLNVDKKIIRRMAKTYYKSTFNKDVESDKLFESFYDVVINGAAA